MNAAADRHSSSAAPHEPEAGDHGFRNSGIQFLIGLIGLTLITVGALRIHLQPGSVSLLYLIVIVFVSLRAGFVTSFAVSVAAVFCLDYFIRPHFPSTGQRNPLDMVATIGS